MQTNQAAMEPRAETGIYSMHRYIYSCQRLAHWAGELIGLLMLRGSNIKLNLADTEPGVRYVIAANHQSYLDPWMLLARIPFPIWQKIGFPRAFVANRFFSYPIIGGYLKSMGGIPAREHKTDPYGLDYASYLLRRGQSIVLFPEGHITLHRENSARRGVQVLAGVQNVRIIPVHFEWKRPRWQARFDIGIGKPFDGSKMSAQEILDRVYDVPVR